MVKWLCTAVLCMLIFNPGFIKGFKHNSLAYDDESNTFGKSKEFGNIRSIRKAGDKAAEGNCQSFMWGGDSSVHWYSCCNNCESNAPNYRPICDGHTYHSASSKSYCNKCGVDKGTGSASKFRNEFRCGGCSGQNKKEKYCKTGMRLIYNVPGLCWAHTRCFKYYCERSYGRKKRDLKNLPGTCFNLQCEHGETTANCPVDCCHEKNPSVCTWQKTKCVPTCCGEPSCCLSSTGNMLHLDTYFGIGLTMLIVFLL